MKIRTIWMLLVGFVLVGGCVRPVYMDPDASAAFNRLNDSAQVWVQRCKDDPNTCSTGLGSVARELNVWTAIVNETDPNSIQ